MTTNNKTTIFDSDDDDDDDDELLFRPSGLKSKSSTNSPKTPSTTTTTTTITTNSTSSAAAEMLSSNVISQEESADGALGSTTVATSTQGTTKGSSSTTTTTTTALLKTKTLEEIQNDAQLIIHHKLMMYHDLTSTSFLKWYVVKQQQPQQSTSLSNRRRHRNSYSTNPGKNRKKKGMKGASGDVAELYPCYICPNVQYSIVGYEDNKYIQQHVLNKLKLKNNNDTSKTTTKKNVLIKFIGTHRTSYGNQLQVVSDQDLLPYNYHDDPSDTGTTTGSTDHIEDSDLENVINKRNDDDNSDNNNNDKETTTVMPSSTTAATGVSQRLQQLQSPKDAQQQWSASYMSMYLKILQQNQKEFMIKHSTATSKNNTKENSSDPHLHQQLQQEQSYKIQVEEQFLQLLVPAIIRRNQPKFNATQTSDDNQDIENDDDNENNEEDVDDVDDDDDDDDDIDMNNDKTTITMSNDATTPPAIATPLDPNSLLATTDRQKAGVPMTILQQQQQHSDVKKLRAGDVIEFCPPHLVADRSNIMRGTVMECHPRDEIAAVLVSTGHWLPRYHQIRIVQRMFLKNKTTKTYMNIIGNGSFVRIEKLKLDKSLNGAMDNTTANTYANNVAKMFNETKQELSKLQQQKVDETTTEQAETNPSMSSNKRKRNEKDDDDTNIIAPATKKANASNTNTIGISIHELQHLWDTCNVARQRRRADLSKLDVQQGALQTAIRVQEYLQNPRSTTTEKPVDTVVRDISDQFDCSVDRIIEYLSGNTNNLLSLKVVSDMTKQFEEFLSSQSLS